MAVTAAGLSSFFSCSGSAAAITTTVAPTTAHPTVTATATAFADKNNYFPNEAFSRVGGEFRSLNTLI